MASRSFEHLRLLHHPTLTGQECAGCAHARPSAVRMLLLLHPGEQGILKTRLSLALQIAARFWPFGLSRIAFAVSFGFRDCPPAPRRSRPSLRSFLPLEQSLPVSRVELRESREVEMRRRARV
jgi:hypothetical protein